MRNDVELQVQIRRLELEIEHQKAIMRVAAAHLKRAEQTRGAGNPTIRELIQRLRSNPTIQEVPELEAA